MTDEFLKTVRGIFYRFGSTRLLAMGMYLWFLAGEDLDNVEAYLGGTAFVLTVVLMQMRPHTAHKDT